MAPLMMITRALPSASMQSSGCVATYSEAATIHPATASAQSAINPPISSTASSALSTTLATASRILSLAVSSTCSQSMLFHQSRSFSVASSRFSFSLRSSQSSPAWRFLKNSFGSTLWSCIHWRSWCTPSATQSHSFPPRSPIAVTQSNVRNQLPKAIAISPRASTIAGTAVFTQLARAVPRSPRPDLMLSRISLAFCIAAPGISPMALRTPSAISPEAPATALGASPCAQLWIASVTPLKNSGILAAVSVPQLRTLLAKLAPALSALRGSSCAQVLNLSVTSPSQSRTLSRTSRIPFLRLAPHSLTVSQFLNTATNPVIAIVTRPIGEVSPRNTPLRTRRTVLPLEAPAAIPPIPGMSERMLAPNFPSGPSRPVIAALSIGNIEVASLPSRFNPGM